MEQQIRFCTSADGTRIAYATAGEGPALVLIPGWVVGHLQFGWQQPEMRRYYEGLADGRLLVRYDRRGTGLSDRKVTDLSLEAQLRDLEAVVDTLELERFALMGWSEGGSTAIVYAARHPDRASHLILYASCHRWPYSAEAMAPILALFRSQWGMGSAAMAATVGPSASASEAASIVEAQRVSVSGEMAAALLQVSMEIDVTSLLKDLRMSTLIAHRRGDTTLPLDGAREMAALIPNARFQPLDGDLHPPWWGDSKAIVTMVDAFLRGAEPEAAARRVSASLVTILFTDLTDSTALTQRLGDAKAQELVRAHNAIVRESLEAHSGTEIKHTGDGIMASFPSASGALECAVAIQRAVGERADEMLAIHIGVNAGEPVAEESDLFGTAVQLARRICDQAQADEVLVSNVVRELVAGKGFLFADRGDAVLRGFEDPVRLYELRWREE